MYMASSPDQPFPGWQWTLEPGAAAELAKLRDEVARLGLTQAQMLDRVSKFLDKMQPVADGFDDVKRGRISVVDLGSFKKYAKPIKRKRRPR